MDRTSIRTGLWIGLVGGMFVLGIGIGARGQLAEQERQLVLQRQRLMQTPPQPAPSPAPSPEVRIETRTQTIIPPECMDALDAADAGFNIASAAFGDIAELIDSFMKMDFQEFERLAPQFGATTSQAASTMQTYRALSADCRRHI